MGDAAVRVQTRFANAAALMNVVGTSLTRGSLRLPIHLKFEHPFEVVIAADDGTEAVRGTAEIIEHAGHATWIRFLSAAPELPGDDSARCMLADVDVSAPAAEQHATPPVEAFESITAVSEPETRPRYSSEAFEAMSTAVKEKPAALSEVMEMPAGLAEPVPLIIALPLLPPPPAPVFDVSDTSMRMTGPAAENITAAVLAISPPPAPAHSVEQTNGTAVAIVTEDAEPIRVNETRDTEASPPLVIERDATKTVEASPLVVARDAIETVQARPIEPIQTRDTQPTPMPMAAITEIAASTARDREPNELATASIAAGASAPHDDKVIAAAPHDDKVIAAAPHDDKVIAVAPHDDKIAAERGVRPITSPYRDAGDDAPQRMSRSRRIVIAAVSCATLCLAITVGVVVWAHGAIANAETKPAVRLVEVPIPVPAPATVAVVSQPQQPAPAAPPVVNQPAAEAPVAMPATCALDIDATAHDAIVIIDGREQGAAPLTANVACGAPIDIQIRHPRYETFKRTITPTAHESVHAVMEREKTTLTVWSDPPAQVTYNGTPIGTTPLTTKVNRFEQGTLRFSAPGVQGDWRRIMPKTGSSTVTVKLARAR